MQQSWYRMFAVLFGLLGTVLAQTSDMALATESLKVLIVDGANNHDWPRATRILREILIETGRFAVEVATSPSADASSADWAQWRPKFADYDVVVSNFNGGHKPESLHWPKDVEQALEEYVRRGGGLVIFHSANNSFPNWPAYNEMIGLGWRDKEFGPSLIVDADEHVVRIPTGQGFNPGHGPDHDFLITVLDRNHPITKGLPKHWMHPTEQLTHGQHGPADHVHVLTYAFSRDTKQNEVVDWVVPYGKGRVFVTMQGHLWRDKTDVNLRCIGFQTILARGTEWAAIGQVTLPVPKDFPTATEIRVEGCQLEIPAGMLEGNPTQLSIRWIDFFRS